MQIARDTLLATGLVLLLLLLSVGNLYVGEVAIPVAQLLRILKGEIVVDHPSWSYIVEHRLNRSLVAATAGGGLAVSGLLLQVFFRNPLAGPGVLGISSGASLGVAAVMLGGIAGHQLWQGISSVIAGMLGAVGVLLLLLLLSSYVKQVVTLLVVGLMMSYFVSALVHVLILFADAAQLRAYAVWGMGSFEGLTSSEVVFFTAVLVAAVLCAQLLSRGLNGWVLGEAYAHSLGIPVKQLKWCTVVITGVLVAVVTLFCGPIGFIGMAVPQIVQQIVRSKNHAVLTPLCFVTGAVLGIAADLVVRLTDNVLPVNTVTAIIGTPVIIGAIINVNKRGDYG